MTGSALALAALGSVWASKLPHRHNDNKAAWKIVGRVMAVFR